MASSSLGEKYGLTGSGELTTESGADSSFGESTVGSDDVASWGVEGAGRDIGRKEESDWGKPDPEPPEARGRWWVFCRGAWGDSRRGNEVVSFLEGLRSISSSRSKTETGDGIERVCNPREKKEQTFSLTVNSSIGLIGFLFLCCLPLVRCYVRLDIKRHFPLALLRLGTSEFCFRRWLVRVRLGTLREIPVDAINSLGGIVVGLSDLSDSGIRFSSALRARFRYGSGFTRVPATLHLGFEVEDE